jgi:hypothetical protein
MSIKDTVIGTFDKVAVFVTLGIPSQYHCVKYCVEYVTQGGRKVACSNECRHISTVALRDFISKALQENGKQLESLSTLVFFLDTVLLDLDIDMAREIPQESKDCNQKSRRELFIHILRDIVLQAKRREDTGSYLIQELSLLGIPEECGRVIGEAVQKCLRAVNERCVAFVPGVITRASQGALVTFRIDEAYPVVVGAIAAYTLDKLLRITSANDESLAIVVDTTHGMNYFALALKDAIQLAAELYAYTMLLNGKPRKIVIYHYNSDPVDVREASLSAALSVKLHLLSEIPVAMPTDDVRSFRIVPRYVPLFVEQAINSSQSVQTLIEWLAARSGNLLMCSCDSVEDAWRRVVYSALLFSRNLFLWALRQAYDISSCCTSTGDLANDLIDRVKAIVSNVISVVEEMKVKRKTEKRTPSATEYKVSYCISGNASDVLAVMLPILGEVLKSYAMYANVSAKDVYDVIAGAQSCCIEDQDKEALSFVQSLRLDEEGKSIRDSSNNAYICFEMDKVLNLAKKLYPPQDLAILEHELRDIRRRIESTEKSKEKMKEESMGKDKTETKVETKSNKFKYYIVKLCNNTYVMVSYSTGGKINQRNVYAHAGLARGLPWFAVVKPGTGAGMAVVCLGGPQNVINFVLASARS